MKPGQDDGMVVTTIFLLSKRIRLLTKAGQDILII